ncbi:MAG: hypothetical protein OXG60_18910 [Chloroflexi bacterium]|nr:hypothetical protein [Chloroflexota bacterium]
MNRLEGITGLPFQWLLPLIFFCLGLIYLYASPNFESPDSIYHLGVIKWIAEHDGALPVQSPDHDHLYEQEASQPPLYYLLMTPIWLSVDTEDFDEFYYRNPLVNLGHHWRLGNRNLVFYKQPHPPDLTGTSRAIYIMRLVTLGMATVTIAAVYQSARAIRPDSVGFAVLTTGFVAFNPQFLFISTSVSNDNLAAMLGALITWQLLVMLREGFQTRRSLLLAAFIALMTLAKLSAMAFVVTVALAGVWLALRKRALRGLVILGGSMLLCWLVIASWWYWRNLMLYQELFGTQMMIANFGGRSTTIPRLIAEEFEGFRRSYWGLFGWFTNLTNEFHYVAMDALTALALAGLVVYLLKNRKKSYELTVCCVLGAIVSVGMAMVIWFTLQTTASQGRLLFPYSAAISLLLALGLTALRIPAGLIALPMFAFAAIVPFVYIVPHYDHPPRVENLPETAVRTFARWQDITLIAHEVPPQQRWMAGDAIPITFYWRPLAQSDVPLALFISLIDRDKAIATIDTFPGWGTLPTTWWQPDTIYRDEYILEIPESAKGFSLVQLQIGWYPFPYGSNIRPVLEDGALGLTYTIPVGAFVGESHSEIAPEDATRTDTLFGDSISLDAFRFARGDTLELYWRLQKRLSGDWRVLAIVFAEEFQLGQAFEVLMQADSAPKVPLVYLDEGETLRTSHRFEVPENLEDAYPIYVAWYNFDTGERLAIPHPENMLKLPAFNFASAAK